MPDRSRRGPVIASHELWAARRQRARGGIAILALALAQPALAQASGDAPPPTPSATPDSGDRQSPAGRQVYLPADFARYNPRNAFDMITNLPGFSIRESEQARGLGQATGNVLFNGERPSNKADLLFTQLQRIPAANVVRIELVDGSTLNVPGLSGQVANVVVRADTFSGQFAWRPQVRPHFAKPLYTRGQVSASGKAGKLEYEVGIDNNDSGRGAAGGLTRLFNAAGDVIERRDDVVRSSYDSPKASAKLTLPTGEGAIARLNASYQRIYDHDNETGLRTAPGLVDRTRLVRSRSDTWNYEIGGDFEFNAGPGRLKLIGLNRKSHEPFREDVITRFADGAPAVGDRYAQVGDIGERIVRAEYSFKALGGDWQVSGEGAFNTLDNVAALGVFDPAAGSFVETPFPGGTGKVSEDRYEGSVSYSRPLTPKLSLQIVAAAEKSTISQSGMNSLTRRFVRPKGTLSLAWTPRPDLDLSVKLRRRVGQLSFYDFLARSFLDDGNQNAGNNQLVPQQDWTLEFEANKRFGPWGSAKLLVYGREVEDYVTIIPIGTNGESVGNVPRAHVRVVQLNSTINFDPIGFKGAKLDIFGLFQKAYLDDPFTGESRPYNGLVDREIDLQFRHDVPDTDWAWGGSLEYTHFRPTFRRNSTDLNYEGPVFAGFFVEHKNVAGLTMQAEIFNVLNARQVRDRRVFAGLRGASPLVSIEKRDRLIGPIFAYSIKGSF